MKKDKLQKPNPIHLTAAMKSGSGSHGDKKKEAAKKACRGKVSES